MIFSRDDLRYVKHSLISLTLSVLLCIGLLWLTDFYQADARQAQQQAQQQLIATRQSLNITQDDLTNIAAYASQYQALLTQHLIGDELRLDWVEGLSRLRQQNTVADFRYSIQPQTVWQPSPAFESGDFQIHFSAVNLQFDLLHEGQLLNFLNVMERDLPGKLIVERCQIERRSAAPVASSTPLSAECHAGWITLKHKDTP